VTRQRSCRILKRKVVGRLPPQKALNSSVSPPIVPARGALWDMRCVAINTEAESRAAYPAPHQFIYGPPDRRSNRSIRTCNRSISIDWQL
jgi:hypothetical protein